MSARRITIGRTFKTPALPEDDAVPSQEQIFTLSTGRRVAFALRTIPANEVEDGTFVIQETNGRDQASLTSESLKDITRTLRLQQFFPCIGIEREDGVEIIDGSRRRAAAILCHTPLKVLITTSAVSAEEARKLAADIQTAKEHNLREVGLRLMALKESGLNQKQIAAQEKLSPAKVSRAMQAAAVPQELVSLFPVQSELHFADYKLLAAVDDSLAAKGVELSTLIEQISEDVDLILSEGGLAEDEMKNKLLKLIQRKSSLMIAEPKKEKAKVVPLWSFDDKDKYARKRINGRTISFEFNRLTKEVMDELEQSINEVLAKHLD